METMGCQMNVNVADSERMVGQLRAMGYRRGEQG
jgi:tRNA A37 methylthiotransferase MiaB